MFRLVLLRHGESEWNRANRFTGWTDVDLSAQGVEEARAAARLLLEAGFGFDIAYTSLLKRAIRTLWIVLDEMDLLWIPVEKSWRLNERHYGALQGLDKAETAARYGEAQVREWRRGYAVRPPALDPSDPRNPAREPRYAELAPEECPLGESLADTVARVIPFWEGTLRPAVAAGRRVLVSAHGNSIRALMKHLEQIPDGEIVGVNVPTGIPVVYELDRAMKPAGRRYLGEPAEVERRIAAVAAQGRARA